MGSKKKKEQEIWEKLKKCDEQETRTKWTKKKKEKKWANLRLKHGYNLIKNKMRETHRQTK